MTLRLVALMSVVLLLSLAVFGLSMQHYQDRVMAEVARTASAVGRAALHTFEFAAEGRPRREVLSWQDDGNGSGGPASVDRRVVVDRADELVVDGVTDGPETSFRVQRKVLSDPAVGAIVVTCRTDGPEGEERCETLRGDAALAAGDEFTFRVDDVRAEPDAARGLILRIPRLAPGGPAAPGGVTDFQEEIQLPIPVQDYQDLFASLRRRSLFLFLGVFLVGTVLSAGLAARFTRPIRRLDAGIRRLSEGDLDTAVEVHGKDEIARLGRTFNEMTRRLRANRDRAREMVRREKLSALGRLAAGVAHDVRNPLHSIGLTLQHLRETCRPESAERAADFDEALDVIRGEIRRLDGTVGTFLGFARGERGERAPVDLAALLREIVALVGKEAEWRRIEIALDVGASAPRIVADGEALRSSLLNLIVNSFEAMPAGGRLELSLRVDDGHLVLEVSDDGKGIPEEDHERVFEFAYTTRDGGSGMGLAMVHQCIVEEHGGRVSLASRPGEGTRVRVELPVPPAEGETA